MTPPPMACAICAHRLATATIRDPHGRTHTEYTHHTPTNHRAVPVPPGLIDLAAVCDFCGEPDPTWTLPVRAFSHTTPERPRIDSPADWHACELCANLIRRDEWALMAARAIARANARQRHRPDPHRDGKAARSLLNYWTHVRANVTGPLRAAEEATP